MDFSAKEIVTAYILERKTARNSLSLDMGSRAARGETDDSK